MDNLTTYYATRFDMKNEEYEKLMCDLNYIASDICVTTDGMYSAGNIELTIPIENIHRLRVNTLDNNSWPGASSCKVFAIDKVDVYNDRVVKVTFGDGAVTKAVCSEKDTFDLDVGITICALKRVFGENGTKQYNNYIRYAHRVIAENEKKKAELQTAKEAERIRQRKNTLNKAARRLKAREEAIDIQKQAIVRAYDQIEKRQKKEDLL